MNPAITILDYLWSLRKTWLKHNENCTCSFEKLAEEHIEHTLTVDQWMGVRIISDIPELKMTYRTAEQWSELCGPAREKKELDLLLEQTMNQASEIMALQASKERLNSD